MGRISLGFRNTFGFQPGMEDIHTSSYTHAHTQYMPLHMESESVTLKA